MAKVCINCALGLGEELCHYDTPCKNDGVPDKGFVSRVAERSSHVREPETTEQEEDTGRFYKSDGSVRDPKSTGRKRAAVLFPLEREKPCEWRGLANCGGGKFPIIGCYEGNQDHRHHGPDKNTLNNSEGNVHRICDDCHNIWHSQNDPYYDPENPYSADFKVRSATEDELVFRLSRKKYFTDEVLTQRKLIES
jgi:hypothetical protein